MSFQVVDLQGNVVPPSTPEEGSAFLASMENRRVALTVFSDGASTSTVFLGLDHGVEGQPLFFETLHLGEDTQRYATWAEALAGHRACVSEHVNNAGVEIVEDHRFIAPRRRADPASP